MWPERVVLPVPAISQGLGLGCCGEQLGVEELIPEPSVERFCKAVLPCRSRFDVGGAGGLGVLDPSLLFHDTCTSTPVLVRGGMVVQEPACLQGA